MLGKALRVAKAAGGAVAVATVSVNVDVRWKLGCVATALFVIALAGNAAASEQSEATISYGLAALNEGRPQVALLLFTRALDEDPDDVDARYYRGLARVQLEQFDGAVDDLSRVVAANPSMQAAHMGLGYAYYARHRYPAAELHLSQVQRESPMAGKARFYLGMARLRSGQASDAAQAFGEVPELDSSLADTSRYYQGVAALRAGDREVARNSFVAARSSETKPSIAKAAAEQLARMDAGAGKPYRIYGSVGFEYDSNVVLIADDDALGDAELDSIGVSNQDDGRSVITVGGTYSPYRSERLDVTLGYEFFQSLHFDLTQFDLQDHRASAGLSYKLQPITLGLRTTYDYFLRETKSFLGEAEVVPWLRHSAGNWGYTDAYYRFQDRNFHGIHFGEDIEDFRGGVNHAAGVSHTFPLAEGAGYVSLGYRFDHDEADHDDGEAFDYDGQLVDVELGWNLPAGIELTTGYAYKYENYASESDGREDNVHHAKFVIRKSLVDGLALLAAYRGTINDSDEDLFKYERHIATIGLEASH